MKAAIGANAFRPQMPVLGQRDCAAMKSVTRCLHSEAELGGPSLVNASGKLRQGLKACLSQPRSHAKALLGNFKRAKLAMIRTRINVQCKGSQQLKDAGCEYGMRRMRSDPTGNE